jgi:hypothetical protein
MEKEFWGVGDSRTEEERTFLREKSLLISALLLWPESSYSSF